MEVIINLILNLVLNKTLGNLGIKKLRRIFGRMCFFMSAVYLSVFPLAAAKGTLSVNHIFYIMLPAAGFLLVGFWLYHDGCQDKEYQKKRAQKRNARSKKQEK